MTRRCTLPLGMVDGVTADAIVRFKIEKRIKKPENAVFAWLRLPKKEQVRRVEQLEAAPARCVWGGNYYPLPPSRGWLVWMKPDSGPADK